MLFSLFQKLHCRNSPKSGVYKANVKIRILQTEFEQLMCSILKLQSGLLHKKNFLKEFHFMLHTLMSTSQKIMTISVQEISEPALYTSQKQQC